MDVWSHSRRLGVAKKKPPPPPPPPQKKQQPGLRVGWAMAHPAHPADTALCVSHCGEEYYELQQLHYIPIHTIQLHPHSYMHHALPQRA